MRKLELGMGVRGAGVRITTAGLSTLFTAALLLTAPTTAFAAPPEILKPTCEAQGGTFSVEQGTKRCVTVSTTEDRTGRTLDGPVAPDGSFYQGTSLVTLFRVTTTTQSQKGAGEITTTTENSSHLGDEGTRFSCNLLTPNAGTGGGYNFTPVDFSICDDLGLFFGV